MTAHSRRSVLCLSAGHARFAFVGVMLAGLALGMTAAQAQSGTRTGQAPGAEPMQILPHQNLAPDPRGMIPRRTWNDPQGDRIEVGRIQAPPDAFRPATGDEPGDLGTTAWRGTPRDWALALIGALPTGAPSPTLGRLTRALLMAPGPRPIREALVQRQNSQVIVDASGQIAQMRVRIEERRSGPRYGRSDPEFTAARIRQLFNTGFVDEAARLLQAQQAGEDRADLLEVQTSIDLLQERDDAACVLAERMRRVNDDPYWGQLRAFCYFVTGSHSAGDLTARLFAENPDSQSALFDSLIAYWSQDIPVPPDAWKQPMDPLSLAILRHTDVAPPAEAFDRANPPVRRALILGRDAATDNDGLVRIIRAAQSAVASGILPPSDLAGVYGMASFSADAIRNPARHADQLPPELVNALFYQRLSQTTVPALQVVLLHEALGAAERSGSYLPVALLHGATLRQIAPSPHIAWAADRLGIAALTSGHTDLAHRWQEILALEAERTGFPPHEEALRVLTMGLALLDTRMALGMTPELDIKGWIKRTQKAELSPSRLARDLKILNAAGIPIPMDAEIWLLQQTGYAPPARPATLASSVRLEQAVAGRRYAEALAMALILAGPEGPAARAADHLVDAINVLMSIGMKDDGRRLAFEALVTQPL